MISQNQAFQALIEANPAPTMPVADRPSADEMLRLIETQHESPEVRPQLTPVRARVAVAAATFAAVLLIGLAALLLPRGEPDVVEPSTTTSTTSTTTTTTTTTPPPTTVPETTPPTIPPAALTVIEDLASRYGTGDVDGYLELFAADAERITARDADPPFVWDDELFRLQVDMAAALNTTLQLADCRALTGGAISCVRRLESDLTRVAGVGPQDDRITLRVDNGLIVTWRVSQGVNATPYQINAIGPFTDWLAVEHPEIPNPHPLTGGVSHWLRDTVIVDQVDELVAEYAAAEGVELDS